MCRFLSYGYKYNNHGKMNTGGFCNGGNKNSCITYG